MKPTDARRHVAVAIVSFHSRRDLGDCLDALEKSDWPDFEVIVCENGGRQAASALRDALPGALAGGQAVRVVDAGGNLGFGGGVNRCLQETPDAWAWWILNPDARPAPEALRRMAERLMRGDCGAVGCTLHFPDGRVQSHGGLWRALFARSESIGYGGDSALAPAPESIERRQNYLNGASILVGRPLLEAVGPMRHDYFLYGEEVEWCLRAGERGLRLGYAAGARVLHLQGTSTGNAPRIADRPRLPVFLDERSRMLVTRDRHPRLLAFAAVAALAEIALRYPRRGAWRQFGWALAGWWAGLTNHRGRPLWAPE